MKKHQNHQKVRIKHILAKKYDGNGEEGWKAKKAQ